MCYRSSLVYWLSAGVWLQVERGNVKAPPQVEEIYRGVAAPSRLKVDEAPTVTEMPKVPPQLCSSHAGPMLP